MTNPQNPLGVDPTHGGASYPMPPVVPAAPAKKKRKWPWIVGALVVLIVIIAVATNNGGSSGDEKSTAATSADAGKGEKHDGKPGLNTPVRDGKFEFVVTGVQKGLSTVGDNPYLTEHAQGQFVIVTLTVKNIGDAAQPFTPSVQKLFDDKGRSFESSTSAQIALGSSDIPVWDNINPGNTVTAKVIYDMPRDAVPAAIELHDSILSDGVTVELA